MINLHEWLNEIVEYFKARKIFIGSIDINVDAYQVYTLGSKTPDSYVHNAIRVTLEIISEHGEPNLSNIEEDLEVRLITINTHNNDNHYDVVRHTIEFEQQIPTWQWEEVTCDDTQ